MVEMAVKLAATVQYILSQPPYAQGGMTLIRQNEQDGHQVPTPTDGPLTINPHTIPRGNQ